MIEVYESAAGRIAVLLDGDEALMELAFTWLAGYLGRTLNGLVVNLEPPPDYPAWRIPTVLEDLLSRTPADLRRPLLEGLGYEPDKHGRPQIRNQRLDRWLWDLADGPGLP